MKALCVLGLLIVITSALDPEYVEKFMEKMQEIAEVCVEETGASDDDLAELIAKKIPPTSHEARCMIFCANKKLGMQNSDGSIDKVGSLMALDGLKTADIDLYKKVLVVFITCGEKAKIVSDPCETATNLAVCAKAEAEAAGLTDFMLT